MQKNKKITSEIKTSVTLAKDVREMQKTIKVLMTFWSWTPKNEIQLYDDQILIEIKGKTNEEIQNMIEDDTLEEFLYENEYLTKEQMEKLDEIYDDNFGSNSYVKFEIVKIVKGGK